MRKRFAALTGLGLFLLALCWGAWAWAQADRGDAEIAALDEKVAQFLDGISTGPAAAAYQQLLAGSPLAKESEALKNLVDRTGELRDKYGEYRRSEKVAGKRVGSDLLLLKYLYKCERFPVVWHFTYYRSPPRGTGPGVEGSGGWRVVAVRFDTDLESLAR